ncbi:MAG: long-chain fatty acid--CoA ligase [Deltaproteobacteria bacterium]|nr:long-chain fatty acid--CoA ligase [Deltaproteobacteria bacterium]
MRGINLATYLEQATMAHPNKTALVFDDRAWTFSQINERANAVANGLLSLGVQKGDRITLFLPNCTEFFFWYFGIMKMGGIVNPLNVMLKERELEYLIGDCTPRVIVTTRELTAEPVNIFGRNDCSVEKMVIVGGDAGENILAFEPWIGKQDTDFDAVPVTKDDLAAILYTSGTTGRPKGVMLTHTNLWINARHCADWAETTHQDITVSALPLFHAYALIHVLAEIWMEGGTVVWISRFDAAACLEAMAKYKATAFHGVATMYYALIHHPQLDEYAREIDLRYAVTGAAVTPEPILKAWNEKFTPLCEVYGITEAGPVVFMNPLPDRGIQKANSCGVPLASEIEVMAVDEKDKPVKPGEIGELVVRGPNVMKGYWGKPDETAGTLANGWLHTGDMVYFDADGYCFVKDRKKDMIITGGFNIYPKEVEDLLYTHPAVGEVQVVGIADPVKGEIALACIALKPGKTASEAELITFCRENAAVYKAPKQVVFFDELPKTATGKLEKVSLRKLKLR